MSDSISQDENKIVPIEYDSQRVLTSEQLAEHYETTVTRIKQNYNENKARYIPGKHFFLLEGEELKQFKDLVAESYLVGDDSPRLKPGASQGRVP